MFADTSVSPSFSEFYCDSSLSGHFLLAPSIYVGRSYKRIFSKSDLSGCALVAEVIKRIVLFTILPALALLSLFLIPLGLICKSISFLIQPNYPLLKVPPNSPRGSFSQGAGLDLSQISEELIPLITSTNEIVVKGNGDCLFESFTTQLLGRVPTFAEVQKERQNAVQWIKENYKTNVTLQTHLINSMSEHYLEKGSEQIVIRLSNAKPDIENGPYPIDTIKDIIAEYLEAMAKDGTFGGTAEIFALSSFHERCVKVYAHLSEQNTVHPEPFLNNLQYITPEKPAFCMLHRYNHYNVYFP